MPSSDKLKKAERVAWRFGGVEPFINFVVANRSEEAPPIQQPGQIKKGRTRAWPTESPGAVLLKRWVGARP